MKICMVVPDPMVKGGIASVVNGYRDYDFGYGYEIAYVESYCDGSKWDKFWKAVHGYYDFARQLAKNRPDIVHIHSSFGPSFYRKMPFIYMAQAKGIPIINHIHGADFDAFYKNASDKKRRLIQKVYLKCQKLIALSDEWKENLRQIVPLDKIAVIENYCMIPASVTSRNHEKQKDIQILFLGEIGLRKGAFDIPAVISKVNGKENRLRLIMAGDGAAEDVKKVKKLFEDYGLTEKVIFPGWVRGEQKANLLSASDILFLPSYNEGMPMTVLEAMAYGKAIITTNVGGIPKLIEENVSGFLCAPGDISGMAERFSELLKNPEKITELGKRARERAINVYSIEKHVEKLLALYETVLKQGGSDE